MYRDFHSWFHGSQDNDGDLFRRNKHHNNFYKCNDKDDDKDEPFSWPFVGLDENNTRNNTEEDIITLGNIGTGGFSIFNNIGPDGHIDTAVGANDEVEWIGGLADIDPAVDIIAMV